VFATRAVRPPTLLVLLAACEVSQEDEVAIGAETAQQIEAQLPVVGDPYIASYIRELGDTIAGRTIRADLDWHFYVVNSHQINAFALPGASFCCERLHHRERGELP